ncbi:MAG: hypothetical protein EBT79_10735 [Actinobacteria bacterium]|nr:hypothetical protein [Actinomycetota bacterium]NBR67727.1 hypothetical protein [Actinomycetota bacterium]
MSTLRSPTPYINVRMFISGLDEAHQVDHMMGLVVDCCGRGGDRPNGIIARPTAGNHRWAPADLDRIVREVSPRLRDGQRVLIHCRSGRSRSTTAAAAVLLDMGLANTPDEAVRMVALGAFRDGVGETPDRRCTTSLREWWEARRQTALFPAA